MRSISLPQIRLSTLFRKRNIRLFTDGLRIALALVCLGCVVLILIELRGSSIEVPQAPATSDERPSTPLPTRTHPDFGIIKQRNVFGQLGVRATPPPARGPDKPAAQLPLTLLGTFTDTDEPYAIIENKTKRIEDAFSVNDSVFKEAKLVAIYSDRVEVERNGQIEVLKLDEDATKGAELKDGVAQVGQDEFLVGEQELNKALENLPLLLTQARAVPYFKDGRPIGVRLYAIKPDSIFSKLGLQNGDILKSINGNNLDDFNQAVKLFEKLRDEKSIAVTLERNGTTREFKYQVS